MHLTIRLNTRSLFPYIFVYLESGGNYYMTTRHCNCNYDIPNTNPMMILRTENVCKKILYSTKMIEYYLEVLMEAPQC